MSTDTQARNKAVIAGAFDDWARGRGGVFDLLADDATWTIVGNSPVAGTYGRDDFLTTVIAPFNARLRAPLVPRLHALYADGGTVVAYFEASATAADGVPYHNTYTWYLDLDGGRVTRARRLRDPRPHFAIRARVAR